MRKFLICWLFVSLLFPDALYAQKERNWSTLVFSSVGKKQKKKENLIYQQKPKWGEFSLKAEKPKKLNEIELNLLQKYEDVRITKYSHAYFLINNGAIGLASKSGEILVEPVAGKMRLATGAGRLSEFYLFGEQTEDFDRLEASINTQADNRNYDIAVPLGLFQAVVARRTNMAGKVTYETVIPAGRYDYISFVKRTQTYFSKKATGFFVYKRNEQGELLCGYCDAEGTEIIPCEYKSVYFDGEEFVGDNSRTMLEWNTYYAEKMRLKKEEVAQRNAVWGQALIGFGQGMHSIAQSMDGPTTGDATSTVGGSSSAGNYRTEYARWERLAERHYNSLTNLGSTATTKSNGKAVAERGTSGGVGHLSTSNYTQMKRALREAQREMVRIRQKAAKAGVRIAQSRWETATVSY